MKKVTIKAEKQWISDVTMEFTVPDHIDDENIERYLDDMYDVMYEAEEKGFDDNINVHHKEWKIVNVYHTVFTEQNEKTKRINRL